MRTNATPYHTYTIPIPYHTIPITDARCTYSLSRQRRSTRTHDIRHSAGGGLGSGLALLFEVSSDVCTVQHGVRSVLEYAAFCGMGGMSGTVGVWFCGVVVVFIATAGGDIDVLGSLAGS